MGRTKTKTTAAVALVLSLGALASVAGGCQRPFAEGDSVLRQPDPALFPPVADALQPSCGTLDCHGATARNLRLYGGRGLRLAAGDNPADDPTTDAEYHASYRSLVDLEPEAMDGVLRGGGVEALSLIRKARGTERHKGGMQMLRNDPLDRCLVAWLQNGSGAGADVNPDPDLDLDPCRLVSRAPRPEAPRP